ncbi:hypothetical protein ACTQ5K_22665 [Niallia sp. Sow4_A1]|jgi:hypothetical protein|uniref:Uncharacterized protein n=1 Tax=Niallia hominis TaxID=3133173 RepID=A0ABV1F6G4_9BACI|nr:MULTISPECIES: hypothetical protein [Bacillaceae]MCF2648763.1 hypothetical protein [Niallia circulans]MCM3361922.1 hypothetical protein [Niallia sp. MER TA 168]
MDLPMPNLYLTLNVRLHDLVKLERIHVRRNLAVKGNSPVQKGDIRIENRVERKKYKESGGNCE